MKNKIKNKKAGGRGYGADSVSKTLTLQARGPEFGPQGPHRKSHLCSVYL